MSNPDVRVFKLDRYTPEMAAGIGLLMHELDPNFSPEPTPRSQLERIIESPDRAQIVAVRNHIEVVGALTLNTFLEPAVTEAYMGAVVTRSDSYGMGIGKRLVHKAFSWSRAQGIDKILLMTERSKPTQPLAFYLHLGAELQEDTETLIFRVPK